MARLLPVRPRLLRLAPLARLLRLTGRRIARLLAGLRGLAVRSGLLSLLREAVPRLGTLGVRLRIPVTRGAGLTGRLLREAVAGLRLLTRLRRLPVGTRLLSVRSGLLGLPVVRARLVVAHSSVPP
ncbi:hypothetical protein ACH4E8_10470 [Streptomyces sp. NPDC017979]|uniref:hypothetical protein n=1 Tax=Streptomyces sp. NPDC017979 TaxID=3365024 RepID=UPI0037B324A5